jgi:RNA polymerase sigma-32 factor
MRSPESGLARYLRDIRRVPMLEFVEEQKLARRWREQQDSQAANGLVTSHLRLVVKIAMGYRGYGLPVGELISEGNLGLMQAVTRFEPERGFRLSTYARWWIRASIQEYVLRSWSLVRVGSSSNSKKLFFNLRHVKGRISAYESGDPNAEHVAMIAIRLGVRQRDVIEMNRRLGGDASLNAPIAEKGDGGEWQGWLVDAGDNQEKVLVDQEEDEYCLISLWNALEVLNPRERRILEARRLTDDPLTLSTLAAEFSVSRERVRQIEVCAFRKVQREVRALVARIEGSPAEARLRGMPLIPSVHATQMSPPNRIRH